MKTRTHVNSWIFAYVPLILVVALSSLFSTRTMGSAWFAGLDKPAYQPPAWVFPAVWTVLYFLIGYAAAGMARGGDWEAFSLYFSNLGLNLLWTYLFFQLHLPTWALGVSILLLLAGGIMMWHFFQSSRRAGLMVAPYVLWLGFALVLNYSIVVMN